MEALGGALQLMRYHVRRIRGWDSLLFIAGDTRDTWTKLCALLAALEPLDLAVLLYPRHPVGMPDPFTVAERPEQFESVTQWDARSAATASDRLPVTPQLLEAVAALPTDPFDAPWDLILLRPADPCWLACAIPHEDMVMVRDDSLLESLRTQRLDVSNRPPDWW